MPPLIYVAPNIAHYGPMPADKYAEVMAALKANKDASNLVTDGNTGSVAYQKIEFEWKYDAVAEALAVTIVADHNWKAKLAGNETIFEMLNDKLLSI